MIANVFTLTRCGKPTSSYSDALSGYHAIYIGRKLPIVNDKYREPIYPRYSAVVPPSLLTLVLNQLPPRSSHSVKRLEVSIFFRKLSLVAATTLRAKTFIISRRMNCRSFRNRASASATSRPSNGTTDPPECDNRLL